MATWLMPESPRFLIKCAIESKNRDKKAKYIQRALESLKRLNQTPVQAYRELFFLYHSLKEEPMTKHWYQVMTKPWTQPRTRRAMGASAITMLLQQFCGVNILATYSNTIVLNILNLRNDDVRDTIEHGRTGMLVSAIILRHGTPEAELTD
jgi:hypothetical protein